MLSELFGREEREQHSPESFSMAMTNCWRCCKTLAVQELWEARKKDVVPFPGPNPKLPELQECPPKKCWEIHKEEEELLSPRDLQVQPVNPSGPCWVWAPVAGEALLLEKPPRMVSTPMWGVVWLPEKGSVISVSAPPCRRGLSPPCATHAGHQLLQGWQFTSIPIPPGKDSKVCTCSMLLLPLWETHSERAWQLCCISTTGTATKIVPERTGTLSLPFF